MCNIFFQQLNKKRRSFALLGLAPDLAIHRFDHFFYNAETQAHALFATRWLCRKTRKFSEKAGIGMPEVGIFEGEPNAFATGAFKDSALVAVSTGLLALRL